MNAFGLVALMAAFVGSFVTTQAIGPLVALLALAVIVGVGFCLKRRPKSVVMPRRRRVTA